MVCRKGILNHTEIKGKHMCCEFSSLSKATDCRLQLPKETPAQMVFWECHQNLKNSLFTEYPKVTASENLWEIFWKAPKMILSLLEGFCTL